MANREQGSGVQCSALVLWGFALMWLPLAMAETPVMKRQPRQASETDLQEGVWGPWSAWTDCSQSCGLGVSERRRQCLPPPHVPLNWGASAYLPPGLPNHAPVISAIRPNYPSQYPLPDTYAYNGGERPPFYPLSVPSSQNAGLPIYRSNQGVAVHDQSSPGAPLYWQNFSPHGQEPLSGYRPSSFPSPSLNYGQLGRSSRPPTNQRTTRVGGGGSRRSVPNNQDATFPRRSLSAASSIRPGQFGYGRVPFSLPLHRPNRNVRHTAHGGNSSSTAPHFEEVEQREHMITGTDADGGQPDVHPEGEKRVAEEEAAQERDVKGDQEREEPGAEQGQGEDTVSAVAAAAAAAGASQAPVESARHSDLEPGRQWDREAHGSSRMSAGSGSPRQAGRHPHTDRGLTRPIERENNRHSSTFIHRQSHNSHERRIDRRTPHPYSPPRHHFPPHSEPLYSFSPALPQPHPHPPQLPPGPSNPNIWLLPPQHSGREREVRGEGERSAEPGGGNWGSHAGPRNFKCSGPEKEYRKCNVQQCPGGTMDPRAEQCSSFNNQEFLGRLYDWEPFTEVGPEQQCELTCRPAGFRFYVRQAHVVRDGTPCANNTPGGVCVTGRCLYEGCDGLLGSGLVRDRCGICGGRDTSCRRVTGSFQNSSVPLGYHHILDIPPGATAINITERKASPNYLALRSGTGQSVVNGRWAVDPPGEYKAGGTTFLYSRPRAGSEGQEGGLGETLTAPGPTTTLLQLFIIHHRKNPGIDYEFYIPVEKKETERGGGGVREIDGVRAPLREISALTVTAEDPVPVPPPPVERRWSAERSRPRGSASGRNARIPPRTDLPLDTQSPFAWRRGGLTECSASCGKGFQQRVIYCVNRYTEQEESERKCDSAAKPAVEEIPCNLHPCPPFWEMGSWSECSVSCGPGVQQRQLQCRQSFGNRSTMVHPHRCSLLPRPNATQPCHQRICSRWEIHTNWSSCSVACGVGKRTRSVRCVSDQGSVVSDRECNARLRPQGTEDCHMGPCITNWYFTDWTETCSAQCGPGVQQREVLCLSSGGGRDGGGGGDCVGEKPVNMKACNGGPCVSTTMWYTGPWGQCSVPCGNGTQRRDIICVQKLGSEYNVTHASQCAHLEKPSPVQTCKMEPCRPQWFTTEWSTCSRSCGKGFQTREVRCLAPDKQYSSACDLAVKPEQEQLCNTLPCSPQLPDENCRDRRHNCMMVVQARLCVYSYYKTACCASCTQNAQRAKRH